ncbi:MAG: trigger factor [Rikenellaceae bacterium]|nr:trigger factor [Rikenellaceae bacterium]
MNIVKQENQDLTVLVKVTVAEADYAEQVDKTLKEYRRKANIPGFRPGKVPASIINKLYRKGVVAEAAYRKATDSVYEYVKENNIDFVGDILPADNQPELDFDNNTEHEFHYELGLAPKVEVELSKDADKLTYYKIKVAKDMKDNYRSNFLRRFGRLADVESVESEEAITATLDNGDIRVEDAYIGLISMTEEERKPWIGKKVGDKVEVNINELYKNPAQRASMLSLKEEELESVKAEFSVEITKIRKFVEPELNEEFFKMAFPAGNVTDEAGLDKYLTAQIEEELDRESKYLFTAQLRNYLIEKAGLKLPEEFLKRWLYVINEGKFTMEEIEKDFDGFVKMMTWNIIRKHYETTLNLTVGEEDMLTEAKALAQMQFAQYGMGAVPEETLTGYAKSILSNKEEAQKIYDKLTEDKVVEAVKPMIKVSNKSVSTEEFSKIAQTL